MKATKLILSLILYVSINNTFAQTKTDLLCNKGWKKIAFTVAPAMQYWSNGANENDLFASERACTKDDYYVFNKSGIYELLNGDNFCTDEDGQQISTGKWAFLRNDNTVLNLSRKNSQILQKKIIKLTQSTFSFTYTVTKNSIIYTFTETFEAIQ